MTSTCKHPLLATMSNWWLIYCRHPDLYEDSPASSEYSTGSTLVPHSAGDKVDQIQAELSALQQDGAELQSVHIADQNCLVEQNKGDANAQQGNKILYWTQRPTIYYFLILLLRIKSYNPTFADEISKFTAVGLFPSGGEDTNNAGVASASSSTEFSSPIQVTPLFRSLAAGIPSPKFSESVSHLKPLCPLEINPLVAWG